MRIFEKEAVRLGGGGNHRFNLSDGVMLKDNHLDAAGGIANAVKAARSRVPFVRKSTLYSLADIADVDGKRVRTQNAYDRQYLAGRYGADPYLSSMLDWGGLNE